MRSIQQIQEWWMTVRFGDPFWLWLIPLVCMLVWFLLSRPGNKSNLNLDVSVKRKQSIWFPQIAAVLAKAPAATMRKSYRWLNILLLCLIVSSGLVAMSDPWTPGSKQAIKTKKRNIVLVVDTSIAMILRDYRQAGKRINRMAFVRKVLSRVIRAFSGDRISVIVYSNDAHVFVPFTDDQQLLLSQVARIRTELSGRTNELGKALAFAIKYRSESLLREKKQSLLQPVVILFSHGARPVGEISPLQALALFQQKKQKLYTVGIGGKFKDTPKENVPGLVFDPVNTVLLKQLASATGGEFHYASSADRVDPMIRAIRKRENAHEDIRYQTVRKPLYRWPLMTAILLLFAWQSLRLLNRGLYRGARA